MHQCEIEQTQPSLKCCIWALKVKTPLFCDRPFWCQQNTCNEDQGPSLGRSVATWCSLMWYSTCPDLRTSWQTFPPFDRFPTFSSSFFCPLAPLLVTVYVVYIAAKEKVWEIYEVKDCETVPFKWWALSILHPASTRRYFLGRFIVGSENSFSGTIQIFS